MVGCVDDISESAGQTQSPQKTAPRAFSPEWLILCLSFVLVRLPFMFTVPMSEAPDEFAHYWVIRFLTEHHRLPSAAEVAAGGPSAVYGSLPQFGYLPHALLCSFVPNNLIPFYERFGSLAAGLVLLFAGYKIAKLLFPTSRLLQLALPAVLIFHPQLAFLHAYANCDSVSSALAAVLLLLTVQSIKCGVTVKRSGLVGLLLGWLALSKFSGLAVVPAVAAGLIASTFINQTPIITVVYSVVACVAAAAATCGWWFYRNYHEFNGDLLGTQTMYKSWALTFHKDLNYHQPASHIIKSLRWWRMMFFSFWGMFGYMTRYLWRPVYIAYVVYLVASVIGLVRAGVVNFVKPAWDRARVQNFASFAVLWLCVVTNLAAMIWASTGNLGGPQGRYLFTSEIPVVALMLAGLNSLGGKRAPLLVISFVLFNAIVCIGACVMLILMYGGFHGSPL